MTHPENGKFTSSALEIDQEYTFGQVVRFACDSGFALVGPAEIHCSTNGAWSGEIPKCMGKIHLLFMGLDNRSFSHENMYV